MQTSAEGIAMIKRFEGLRLTAYTCSSSIFTIGYGHTGKDVTEGMSISIEKAEQLFNHDLAIAETAINTLVKVSLTQCQFDALVSWTYNLGSGNLMDSTLLKVLNAGEFNKVPEQMKKWVYVKKQIILGLVRRRDEEAILFKREMLIAKLTPS